MLLAGNTDVVSAARVYVLSNDVASTTRCRPAMSSFRRIASRKSTPPRSVCVPLTP